MRQSNTPFAVGLLGLLARSARAQSVQDSATTGAQTTSDPPLTSSETSEIINTTPTSSPPTQDPATTPAQSTQVVESTAVVVTTQQTTVPPTSSQTTAALTYPTTSNTQHTTTHSISVAISTDSLGVSAVVIVDDLTTTIPAELASSVAAAASSSQAALNGTNAGNSNASSTKSWAIPVGVVGGILVLVGILFVCWRLFRKRSGYLSEDAPIRWPEVRPADDNSSLMPMGARRVHGAGIEFPSESSHAHSPSNGSFANSMRETSPSVVSMAYGSTEHLNRQPSYGANSAYATSSVYLDDPRRSFYDPYLGNPEHPYPPSTTPPMQNHSTADIQRRGSNMSLMSGRLLPPGAVAASVSGATSGSRTSVSDDGMPLHDWAVAKARYLAEGNNENSQEMVQHNPFVTPDLTRSGTIASDASPTRSMKLSVANPGN